MLCNVIYFLLAFTLFKNFLSFYTNNYLQAYKYYLDAFAWHNPEKGYSLFFAEINLSDFFRHVIIEKLLEIYSKILTKNLSLKIALREIAELYGLEFLTVYTKALTLEGIFKYYFRKNWAIQSLNFLYLFFALSLLALLSVESVFYSVLLLIILFLNTALYLLVLKVEFIGLLLLVVYIGGISVLFLFVIFLLDLRYSTKNGLRLKGLISVCLGLALLIGLNFLAYPYINNVNVLLEEPNILDKDVMFDLTNYFLNENIKAYVLIILLLFVAVVYPISINQNEEKKVFSFWPPIEKHLKKAFKYLKAAFFTLKPKEKKKKKKIRQKLMKRRTEI